MYGTLFIVWTMVGAASATLAAVHGVVWLLDRRRLASLAFCVAALAVAAIAALEFAMMGAASPAEYAQYVRLLHLPLLFLIAGLVFFVQLYLGTGRRWLGWTVIGLRAVITLVNLAGQHTATWHVTGLERVPVLGELASTSGDALVRPWQLLATATTLLMIAFVMDAALALGRRPEREARRRALLVGGAIAAFLIVATVQSQLVVWNLIRMPVMLSPPFLIMLAAITYELCRDIVAAARIESEARRLRDELAHVARVGTLGELSGSLAHELNQPLAAILRNAEAAQMLLRADAPDLQELRAIVADIRADDQRAGAIIERMRSLLKKKSLELNRVSLQSLAQEVLALVRSDAVSRRVALECAIPEALPLVVADRVQLSQVLLNLLVNGIDAVCDANGRARRVALEARRADDRSVEILVADSGHGIRPDMLSRLFDPFVTTKANGLGIGLAVSRTIVEAHGGRLWAHNNEQSGATFRFTLPVAPGAA